jgi:hypothetical protein
MADNLASAVRDELAKLLAPITVAASLPSSSAILVGLVGHVGALGLDPNLRAEIGRLTRLANDIEALKDDELGSWEGLAKTLELIRDLTSAIRGIESVVSDPRLGLRANKLGQELTEALLAVYLRAYHPRLFRTFAALFVIEVSDRGAPEAMAVENGTVVRLPWPRDRFRFDRLSTLLKDPGFVALKFLPNEMSGAQDAHLGADSLFFSLQELAHSFKLGWVRDFVGIAVETAPAPEQPGEEDTGDHSDEADDESEPPDAGPPDLSGFYHDYWPRFIVYLPPEDASVPVASKIGLAITASSAEQPDAVRGYIVAVLGEVGWSEVRGNWRLELIADGSIPTFVVGPGGVKLAPSAKPAEGVTAAFVVERVADPGAPAFRVGPIDGTRLEIGALRFRTDLALSLGRQEVSVSLEAQSGTLVVALDDGDSFLRAILPKEGLRTDFDLGISWSNRVGLHFKGSATLEVHVPVQKQIAGFLSVSGIRLALRAEQQRIHSEVSASGVAQLGPLAVAIDQIGLQATLSFPESGGNLGVVDLSFGFKPPSGLGILLDAGPVTGGGFLSYDDTAGRYFGALELEVFDVGIKAIGILDTRLPGGRPAYSFLILVSAEFTPIPLGFGFNLVGVGGLVGIHRSVDVGVLRDRLGSGALDHILFPKSPVSDAVQIVSDLRAVFPPTEDHYIVGPTARISWGTSAIVEGKLGILLELPDGRIVLIGSVRAALPKPDDALVELNLDVFGQMDPQRALIELEGKLTEPSFVGPFDVQGAFAFRLIGGDSPSFALAIGGFNEDYQPPPNFPTLERLTVPIDTDVVHITLEGYLAITSNTFQIGAAVHVYAEASKFNIVGDVGFDVLFTFSPFSFIADFSGKVALNWGDTELASIQLEAKINGPAPWHAWGEACLVIKWWPDICVPFDTGDFGSDRQIELPVQDPWPQLRAAIESVENWSSSRPKGAYRRATMTAASDSTNLLDPTGGLVFRQPVVPLGRRITRFGQTQPPGGADRFTVAEVVASGKRAQWSSVEDFFAPALFEELSDDEKLSRPSFERMAAGFAMADDAVNHGAGIGTIVDYETKIVDSAFETRQVRPYRPTAVVQLSSLQRASAAQAPLRHSGVRKFTPLVIQPLVAMTEERFIVASSVNLAQRTDIVAPATKGFVLGALAEYLASHPDQIGTLQVVSLDELAA